MKWILTHPTTDWGRLIAETRGIKRVIA